MSRASVSNENYELAYGVDHAIGTFFIVYGPEIAGPGDRRILSTFNTEFGYTIGYDDDGTPATLNPIMAKAMKPFLEAKGKNLAEEHIIGIAKALGLHSKELELEVWKLWD